MWHNIFYMFAKSNSNVSIFWPSKGQNVKILQKVSRPERFSTLFQCMLFFFPDWAEVEKIGFIPSIKTNLQCFNQVFKISYDKTWIRGSIPGGQIVTSGMSRPEQTYFFLSYPNWPWPKIRFYFWYELKEERLVFWLV